MTAADIQLNQNVELVNPDQHICTLDKKKKCEMELEVKVGRGFCPGDENKVPGQAIGVIAVDSLFSPVTRVRYAVENARVGNRKDSPRNPPPVDRNPPPGDPAPRWDSRPRSDAVEILVDGPGADVVVIAGRDVADVVSRYVTHKNNHIAAVGGDLAEAVRRVRQGDPLGRGTSWLAFEHACAHERATTSSVLM